MTAAEAMTDSDPSPWHLRHGTAISPITSRSELSYSYGILSVNDKHCPFSLRPFVQAPIRRG